MNTTTIRNLIKFSDGYRENVRTCIEATEELYALERECERMK